MMLSAGNELAGKGAVPPIDGSTILTDRSFSLTFDCPLTPLVTNGVLSLLLE